MTAGACYGIRVTGLDRAIAGVRALRNTCTLLLTKQKYFSGLLLLYGPISVA